MFEFCSRFSKMIVLVFLLFTFVPNPLCRVKLEKHLIKNQLEKTPTFDHEYRYFLLCLLLFTGV